MDQPNMLPLRTPEPRDVVEHVVELELMRVPAIARLNPGRRQAMARGIADVLAERGLLVAKLPEQPVIADAA